MKTAVVLIIASLSNVAAAGESCQALLAKVSSGLAAADNKDPFDKQKKCLAYELVAADMGAIAADCSSSQADVDLASSKFPPLAKRLADAEVRFCAM